MNCFLLRKEPLSPYTYTMNRSLSWHISQIGLSNDIVEELMSNLVKTKRYLGVVSLPEDVEKVKKKIDKREGTLAIIVNVGAHFVCVIVQSNCLIYIDSFAGPISISVISLLSQMASMTLPSVKRKENKGEQRREGRRRKRKIIYRNKRQLQSFSSTHCGLYAALFATWYLSSPGNRMTLEFSDDDLLSNDKKCVEYLKKFANTTDY